MSEMKHLKALVDEFESEIVLLPTAVLLEVFGLGSAQEVMSSVVDVADPFKSFETLRTSVGRLEEYRAECVLAMIGKGNR